MKRMLWLGIALAIVALFAFVIPIHLAAGLGAAYFIIGGVLALFFFFNFFKNSPSLFGGFSSDLPKMAKWMNVTMFVLAVFGGAAIFGFTDMRTRAALKKDGVFGTGKLTGGEQTTKRGSETSTVEYSFTTKKGEKLEGSGNISSTDFNNAYEGMPVNVIYLPDHPGVNRLVMSPDDRKEFGYGGGASDLLEQLENIELPKTEE